MVVQVVVFLLLSTWSCINLNLGLAKSFYLLVARVGQSPMNAVHTFYFLKNGPNVLEKLAHTNNTDSLFLDLLGPLVRSIGVCMKFERLILMKFPYLAPLLVFV